jgi:hypothetical protein
MSADTLTLPLRILLIVGGGTSNVRLSSASFLMLYCSLIASSNCIVTPNKKTGAEAPVKAHHGLRDQKGIDWSKSSGSTALTGLFTGFVESFFGRTDKLKNFLPSFLLSLSQPDNQKSVPDTLTLPE